MMTYGYGFSYAGSHSDDFHLFAERTIHPITPPLLTRSIKVPERPGAWYYRTDLDARVIKVDIALQTDNLSTFRPDIRAIAAWLDPSQGVQPLIFDNEPDKAYDAVLYNEGGQQQEIAQLVLLGRCTIEFLVPDTYAYGDDQNQIIAVPPATFSRTSVAYDDKGVQVAADKPRFKALGKNLLPPFRYWTNGLFTGGFKYDNITYTSEYEATIQSKGGAMLTYDVELATGQTYTMSVGPGSEGSLYLYKNHNATAIYSGSEDYTFTADETTTYTFGLYLSASEAEATFIDPQLEEGSAASAFEKMIGGLLVEEETTNLIDNTNGTASGLNAAGTTPPTVELITDPSNPFGTQTWKITFPAGCPTGYAGSRATSNMWNYAASTVYTTTSYLKGNDGSLTLYHTGGYAIGNMSKTGITKNGFEEYQSTGTTGTSGGSNYLAIYPNTSPTTDLVVYLSVSQVEQKDYGTSFIDSTRSPETLTLPSEVLNRDEGTFETEIYVEDAASFSQGNYYMFDSRPNGTNNEKRFLIYLVSQQVKFLIGDNGSSFTVVNVPASNLVDGINIISCRWGKEGMKLEVNGVGVVSSESIQLPDIDPLIYLGCSSTNTFYANTFISNIRISNVFRSDSDLGTWEVDKNTTAYMDFFNNLVVQAPTTLTNIGTASTPPVFTVNVKKPITFITLTNGEEYVQIGQPAAIDGSTISEKELILWDELTSTSDGWVQGTILDDGTIVGTMESNGYRFDASSYGVGSVWHGPALKKSLGSTLSDFEIDALVTVKSTSSTKVGRVEIYLLDVNDAVIGKLSMYDAWADKELNYAELRVGDASNGHMLIDQYGDKPGVWNDFVQGMLRVTKNGNNWSAYVAKIDPVTGMHSARLYTEWIDQNNTYTGELASIQVHVGAYGANDSLTIAAIDDLKVYQFNSIQNGQTPFISDAGDIIEINHEKAKVYKNGEEYMRNYDLDSDFFSLIPGDNPIGVYPTDAAVISATHKPKYL